MFDRCDQSAQLIVGTALDEARHLGHGYLGTEHLLVAFARNRELLPGLGTELLPDAYVLEGHIVAAIGPMASHDADLLSTIGVDLGDIRAAVRQTFGDDALRRLGRRRIRGPWRRRRAASRRCKSVLSDAMGVAPRAKQSFERARRHADRRGKQLIDPTALMLGMLDVDDAMSNRMLRELGREPDELRRALDPTVDR